MGAAVVAAGGFDCGWGLASISGGAGFASAAFLVLLAEKSHLGGAEAIVEMEMGVNLVNKGESIKASGPAVKGVEFLIQ